MNHPNIMKLEEIHESKNSVYLVMELLEGGELLERFSSKVKNTSEDIKGFMFNIMCALSYLDSLRIMHRDLKPENLIFKQKSSTSELALVDFGLGSKVDLEDYMFKRCGTPGFVAPEIINSSSTVFTKFSPKCDVYSAGLIFYLL